MKSKILMAISALVLVTSCIKDEPLNREADIESFKVDDDQVISVVVSEDNQIINILMSKDADITKLTPIISVTPGATVSPASGVPQDFSDNRTIIYTVTSENKQYQKRYSVQVATTSGLKFDFEDWGTGLSGSWKYPILTDIMWSSGNQGVIVAWFGGLKDFEKFPTYRTTDCVEGEYAAILRTDLGKSFLGVPIFAGSLFRGKFEANTKEPLKSLYLGHIHPKSEGKPYLFKGYYKYTPGPEYKDKNGKILDKTDELSAYAVIFKVTKGNGDDEYLNGETVLTSDKVVAKAIMEDTSAKDEFTYFSIPFEYTEEMDYTENDYKLTVVFSSSKDGNLYEGAIGSTLIVDEVEIECIPFD